ncbi:MAG TPA: transposase [Bellilinea sp.]|nr:transposase [Bellilinea sp.]
MAMTPKLNNFDQLRTLSTTTFSCILNYKMASLPELPNRRSIRYAGYEYTEPGAYFITILTHKRLPLFGTLHDGELQLSPLGDLAKSCWIGLPDRFSFVELDEFVIMPDHFHGIIIINEKSEVDVISDRGHGHESTTGQKGSLGSLIGAFKSSVTRIFNGLQRTRGIEIWQRNYYGRIIRGEQELGQIREYVRTNPWQNDVDDSNPRWG